MTLPDYVPPWIRDNVGLHQGTTVGVTAYVGAPVSYTTIPRMSDGLHPVQAGPVDSVTGALMVGALVYAFAHRNN